MRHKFIPHLNPVTFCKQMMGNYIENMDYSYCVLCSPKQTMYVLFNTDHFWGKNENALKIYTMKMINNILSLDGDLSFNRKWEWGTWTC